MDRKIATIVGAAAALVAVPAIAKAASGQTPALTPAVSYSELLEPIQNPIQTLKIADAQDKQARLQNVQLSIELGNAHHHHHHHHSHDWYRGRGYVRFGGRWVTRDYYNSHHHHHHHHHDDR